jgi:hypothetical protein
MFFPFRPSCAPTPPFSFSLHRSTKEHHMKVNSRLIALMAALAAGSAAAAGTGTTPAGTTISNTATASFTDPTSTTSAPASVNSNQVDTLVLPVPAFDITYDSTDADATKGDDSAINKIPADYKTADALPGSTQVESYQLINNGNVSGYVVNLAANTTNSPTTLPTSAVTYYAAAADTNTDGVLSPAEIAAATPITSLTVPVDSAATPTLDEGIVKFFQVITVPSDAAAANVFSASPQGSAPAGAGTTAVNTYAAVNEAATDLQYAQVTVFTPVVVVNPPTVSTTVTPPTGTTPVNGYTDPNNPSTPIVVSADAQTAYPPADGNTTDDTVTFNINVGNPSTKTDVISLFPSAPVDPSAPAAPKAPQYTSFDAATSTFTLSDGTKVQFLDTTGAPLPTAVNPADGKTYPVVTVAPNGSSDYAVKVTYPDSNPTATSNPAPYTFTVGGDSNNDSDINTNDTTVLKVLPAAMQFGDATGALGTDPAPATTQTVSPKAAPAPGNITSSPDTTDNTAVFPMDIVNQGEYGDTYTLTTPTIAFPNTAGTTTPATYKYVDSTGAELTKVGGNYVTPVVAPNTEYKVFLVVTVPDDAITGSTTIPQTATGNFSTIIANDPNDVVKVGIVNTKPVDPTGPTYDPANPSSSTSGIAVAKYQANGATAPAPVAADTNALTAIPGDTLRYAIIAKNNYNTSVANFVLSDSAAANNVYTYSTFKGATATPVNFTGIATPTVYYKWTGTKAGAVVSSSGFVTAAPTATDMDTVTTLEVAVNTNTDTAITAADIVPALASIRLDIEVTVK